MLKNTSKSRILAKKHKECNSVWSKFWGLMFSSEKKIEEAMVFVFPKEQMVSLHMLFVFYPIDVIFMDEHKKITEIKVGLMPFSFYQPRSKAKYVIEVKHGVVDKTNTWIGDKLKF